MPKGRRGVPKDEIYVVLATKSSMPQSSWQPCCNAAYHYTTRLDQPMSQPYNKDA